MVTPSQTGHLSLPNPAVIRANSGPSDTHVDATYKVVSCIGACLRQLLIEESHCDGCGLGCSPSQYPLPSQALKCLARTTSLCAGQFHKIAVTFPIQEKYALKVLTPFFYHYREVVGYQQVRRVQKLSPLHLMQQPFCHMDDPSFCHDRTSLTAPSSRY